MVFRVRSWNATSLARCGGVQIRLRLLLAKFDVGADSKWLSSRDKAQRQSVPALRQQRQLSRCSFGAAFQVGGKSRGRRIQAYVGELINIRCMSLMHGRSTVLNIGYLQYGCHMNSTCFGTICLAEPSIILSLTPAL